MSEIRRILDQFDRAFSGEAWHGPALQQLLDGVSAEEASKHSIPNAHSIWELVNHIAAWHTIVQHRLQGEDAAVTAEVDWPPVWETTDVTWRRSVDHLVESRERLRKAAESYNDDQLDEMPKGQKDSRYVLLHGLIQHDLYHAGQIAVLKKALR